MVKTIIDVVHDLGRAARFEAKLQLSDAQLLEQFALHRDEAAFEALLHRHGPLVFGVCRRLLADEHDAEDAFQATFLVLACKASEIRSGSLLGNWLYGVAFRIAARARKNAWRRRSKKRDFDLTAVPAAERWTEPDVASLVHEEVRRLPDRYRRPVVLCYLEGRTNEEAAAELHWPVGTVKTRLHKARELLRSRLARRGVTLTAGLLAANTLTAVAPAALADETFRAALAFAAGRTVVAGASSTQALALCTGVLRTMWLSKLTTVAAGLLSVAVIAGAAGVAYRAVALEPPTKDEQKATRLKADRKANQPRDDTEAILGRWEVVSVEMNGKKDPEGEEFDTIRKVKVTFTKEKEIHELAGGSKEYSYKLDPRQKPKAIDLDGDVSVAGVYALDGDTLKICMPNAGKGGGERPTAVATKEGDGAVLLVLKREVKDKAKDK